ncbi:GAF and ANTAR domain-containing protein [Paractinoplanes lichenicola]|uniref:GAF and ANTAR domain-containing protein n=1 Tax=Paractinoplanes lichenicola TaxID=2802976 RepID=A0ABS1VW79_9ACTN|nr:GAF and ANTAR domain-containing protein [Actinoplanes lichenicola]MBL7258715.1 GAF and ANTAR domain-containing protein [Actinoplanes lichenicola]
MTNSRAHPADLARDFVALNQYLNAGGERGAALRRLVDLAVTAVPGCRWSAVTLWREQRHPRTLAVTGEVAQKVDQIQYDLGEGPCLTAAADDQPVHSPDLDEEERWPRFREATRAATAVRGVLSFHLSDGPDRTALNLYTDQPAAFTAEAITLASLFAAHARVLLLHADSAEKAAQLSGALTTSRQIGAAVGILMNVHKVTADQAFDLLRTTSQQLNRKLNAVAEDVTQTGTLPRKPG